MRVMILASLLTFAAGCLQAQMGKTEEMSLTARLEAALAYRDSAPEGEGFFDYPLHGNLGMLYRSASVTGKLSVDLDLDVDRGVEPGESFLQGGRGQSFIKIGYYTAGWGEGRALSVVERLNLPDQDYPPHIFHQSRRQPNPMFTISFGGDTVTQIALSRTEETVGSVEDVLLGIRAFTTGSPSVSVGMVRPAGYPPPLFFLTADGGEGQAEAWMELGWLHFRDAEDRLDLVLGGRKEFASASVQGEFILQHARPLLYLEETFLLSRAAQLGLRGFVHLPTFSTALDASILITVDRMTAFELGTTLFFGKQGSFFSRWKEGNDNRLYLRLQWGDQAPAPGR